MLMSRMYHEAPKEYKFYPETWVLPAEMNDFRCVWCVCRVDTPVYARSVVTKPLAMAFRWLKYCNYCCISKLASNCIFLAIPRDEAETFRRLS